ncbi:hypothetical protein HII31_05740 [Pseudocercospora fuligena]|uniref:Uncharacterized protein n=1 Tax=Pseudocercospora fuligena TaxID=685502 RepID=A0A8H6VLW6_9PEZI|nr:hypothetical protein HII31_05740 [Pseudocercospora fuligena]
MLTHCQARQDLSDQVKAVQQAKRDWDDHDFDNYHWPDNNDFDDLDDLDDFDDFVDDLDDWWDRRRNAPAGPLRRRDDFDDFDDFVDGLDDWWDRRRNVPSRPQRRHAGKAVRRRNARFGRRGIVRE